MSTTIYYNADEDAMFGNQPEATDGVDIDASVSKFEEMLLSAAKKEIGDGVAVESFSGFRSDNYGDYDGDLVERVWEKFDWIVMQ